MSSFTSQTELAKAFLQEVVTESIDHAYDNYITPNFRHHNIYFPSDADSLRAGMKSSNDQFPRSSVEIKMEFENGDKVCLHSKVVHLDKDDKTMQYSCVHTFRFENGKIAELWDVFMSIPETMANELGPF